MDQVLTVLIQTSPIPSHPSTALLEALFRSFRRVEGLLESRIIILCDGCEQIITANSSADNNNETKYNTDGCSYGNGNDVSANVGGLVKEEKENIKHGKASSETASNYRKHLILLRDAIDNGTPPFVPQKNGSIRLIQLSERHGSARAIQAAFEKNFWQEQQDQDQEEQQDDTTTTATTTPLIMICQHDNFFVRDVPYFRTCCEQMAKHEGLGIGLKCLHFLSTATMDYPMKIQKRYNITIDHLIKKVDFLCLGSSSSNNKEENGGGGGEEEEEEGKELLEQEGGEEEGTTTTTMRLIPLVFWYGRTHLSYVEHYRANILNRPLKVGDHLEELLGVKQLEDIRTRGIDAAFPGNYGTYVLDDQEVGNSSGGEVLYHLSGRRVRAATTTTTSKNTSGEEQQQQQQQQQGEGAENSDNGATSSSAPSSVVGQASTKITTPQPQQQQQQPILQVGSFTTARSCRAIVPGLEIVSESYSTNTKNNNNSNNNTKQHAQQQHPPPPPPFKGRFKQKCFHCGLKGHSYKWCPNMTQTQTPTTETIDLS